MDGYQESRPSTHSGPVQFVEQARDEYYGEAHLQTIEFQIARLIVDRSSVSCPRGMRQPLGFPWTAPHDLSAVLRSSNWEALA